MGLTLTPFGHFVTRYNAMVPIAMWQTIFQEAVSHFDSGAEWEIFFDELIQGCTELVDGRLQEIIARLDEGNESGDNDLSAMTDFYQWVDEETNA